MPSESTAPLGWRRQLRAPCPPPWPFDARDAGMNTNSQIPRLALTRAEAAESLGMSLDASSATYSPTFG